MDDLSKTHVNTINACRYCPMCRHSCPSEFIRYRESDTPRGRAILLHNVYRSGKAYDPSMVNAIYNCFLCGACRSWCAGYDLGGYDIPELIKFARKDIVEKGMAPAVVERMKTSLQENDNPYGLDKQLAFSVDWEETTADVLYYMGPEINFKNPEIAKAIVRICRHLDTPVTVLKQEPSSGKILALMGYLDEAITKAQQLVYRIKKTGCKTIVVSDPLAYEAFRKDYTAWGIDMEGIAVMHVSEYLAHQIEVGKLKIGPDHVRVTLADSEFLGRNHGIYDAPRAVIKASAAGNYVEMQWHHEYMQSTGEAAFTFDDEAFSHGIVLGEKIDQKAKSAGAEIIVTLSATAKNNIAQSTELRVIDIAEFVAERIIAE